MEIDLQSLFGLHMHSCTHWLRPRNSSPPVFGLLYEGAILVSQDRRHLCVTPWLGHSQSFPQLRVNNRLYPKNFEILFYSLHDLIFKKKFMNVGINEDIWFDRKMAYCYRSTCSFMIGIKNFWDASVVVLIAFVMLVLAFVMVDFVVLLAMPVISRVGLLSWWLCRSWFLGT